MNRDLPPELWLEILSYLPPDTLSTKLIGVSRYLFEAGMNEVYEEFCVGIPTMRFEKCVHQLQYESVAKRVKKVHVSASFKLFRDTSTGGEETSSGTDYHQPHQHYHYHHLPGPAGHVPPAAARARAPGGPVVGRRLRNMISSSSISLRPRSSYATLTGDDSLDGPSGAGTNASANASTAGSGSARSSDVDLGNSLRSDSSMPELLSVALHRLGQCPNLQEVTIEAIGDSEQPTVNPLYARFVTELFAAVYRRGHTTRAKATVAAAATATSIRTLNVDVDLYNWRNKSRLDYTMFSTLPTGVFYFKALKELNISLEISVRPDTVTGRIGEQKSCIEQLREVLFEARNRLESLIIRMRTENDLPCDIADIFPSMTMMSITFPALKKLRIHSDLYGMNIIRSKTVANFLTLCATNLESLTLLEGKGYSDEWTMAANELKRRRLAEIWEEVLAIGKPMSQLKELEVSLSAVELDVFVRVLEAGLVSGLRKLVLTPLDSYALPFEVFSRIIEAIGKGGGSGVLEDIQVFAQSLSPSHLEMLQNRFPRLKRVYLIYGQLSTKPDGKTDDDASTDGTTDTERSTDEETADAIFAAFQVSAHLDWRNRDVRFEEVEFDPRFQGNPHKELQRRIQVYAC